MHRDHRETPITHVVGAGLAGLSAAVALAADGRRVSVHEASARAGGRCRSYFDAGFGDVIDNGNHLLLSGNAAALGFLKRIGASHQLREPGKAEFAFADLTTGERWTISPNEGRIPYWLLDKRRRVPKTRPVDYLGASKLLFAGHDRRVAEVIGNSGPVYRRLWHPFLLAALNTDPAEASAKLAGAILRETLLKGGSACHPLVASDGLSTAFVDPAVAYIHAHSGNVLFGHRLRDIGFEDERVSRLDFGDSDSVQLGPLDDVILAVPPWIAESLLPGLKAPTEFRAIVNAHYRVAAPPQTPEILGIVNATAEWVFVFPGRLSITISGADRLLDAPRERLAMDLWREVSSLLRLPEALPAWQIIKEKRATFAALPAEDAKRPGTRTSWDNLFLAGDWTQTGLPATIEGAIRSGERAAYLATRELKRRDGDKALGTGPRSGS
jgi:squalene-associated FAD-dependent desaturase